MLPMHQDRIAALYIIYHLAFIYMCHFYLLTLGLPYVYKLLITCWELSQPPLSVNCSLIYHDNGLNCVIVCFIIFTGQEKYVVQKCHKSGKLENVYVREYETNIQCNISILKLKIGKRGYKLSQQLEQKLFNENIHWYWQFMDASLEILVQCPPSGAINLIGNILIL